MVTGTLRLFSEADLDRLQEAVFTVLERTGIRVYGEEFLAGLVQCGAAVDQAQRVARFPYPIVADFIEEHRRRGWQPEREQGQPPAREQIGLSGVIAPFYFDYDRQTRRAPTRRDLLDTIHWADVDCSPERQVDLAVTMSEVDPRLEPIEAYALLLEHTRRPGGAYTLSADQIPFLLELSEVYYGQKVFPRGPDFMTSPLTFGGRLAEHTLAAIRFGQRHFSMGIMPISGSNTPMTLAGTVVTGAAEALGAALVIRSLAPEATFSFAACNGTTDLRKGFALFNAPEALLTNLGTAELFIRRFGGHFKVAAGSDYIDSHLPGLGVAYERVYRAMAISAFTGEVFHLGGQGTLGAGQIFSPVQFILERDLSGALWRLGQGIQVNEETLALETILQVGPGERGSYLESEHTLHHCRELWFPRFFQRGPFEGDEIEQRRDRQMLEAANQHYKDCLARYTPPELAEETRRELHQIVHRARQVLLA